MNFSRASCQVLKITAGLHSKASVRTFSSTKCMAMRFVQFKHEGSPGLGVQLNNGEQIISLSAADKTIPSNLVSFLNTQYSLGKVEK